MASANCSQNVLARRIGVSRSYLSQLINGRREPSPKVREKLLDALCGATFDDLFVIERSESSGS